MISKKIALGLIAAVTLSFSACRPKSAGSAVSGDAAAKTYVAPGKYDEF